MLNEAQVLEAVAEKLGGNPVSREAVLSALLTEDEADLIICMRRERDEEELPWKEVRDKL